LNVETVTREEEGNRVFKKRRTSFDIGDEARLFEQEDHEAHLATSPDAMSQKLIHTATDGTTLALKTVMTP
jgi:hypothetical protein